MTVRISWSPSTYPTIASYDVEHSLSQNGPFTFVANVVHNLTGSNFDVPSGLFFYLHTAGTLADWYRLIAIDAAGDRSLPSAPLRPSSAVPTVLNNVKLDHNYGTAGALRYQAANGAPVEGALIRIYLKSDFDQGLTSAPLAITQTDAYGNWVNPLYVAVGATYTIQFAKEGMYGPDKIEVIV